MERSLDPSGNDVAEVSLLNTAVQEMWPEITSFIRTVLKDTVEDGSNVRGRLCCRKPSERACHGS